MNGEYFDSDDLTGWHTNRVDRAINYGDQNPIPYLHSVRWTGYYIAKSQADYEVFLQNPGEEGGARLFVDGKQVFNDWTHFYASVDEAVLSLTAGAHKIVVEAHLRERWSDPGLRVGIVDPATIVNEEAKKIAASADAVVVPVGFDPYSEKKVRPHVPFASGTGCIGESDAGREQEGDCGCHLRWRRGYERMGEPDACDHGSVVCGSGGWNGAGAVIVRRSPSGKLPMTFDRKWEDNASHDSYYPASGTNDLKYSEGIFLGYRHYDKTGEKPLFPFGFGLSYSTFKYSNLAVEGSDSSNVKVSFDLTNTGSREAGMRLSFMSATDMPACRARQRN